MKVIVKFLLGFFGFGTVNNGITCWFSKHFWDVHDYKMNKGGDGTPSHFYVYACSKCKANFTI